MPADGGFRRHTWIPVLLWSGLVFASSATLFRLGREIARRGLTGHLQAALLAVLAAVLVWLVALARRHVPAISWRRWMGLALLAIFWAIQVLRTGIEGVHLAWFGVLAVLALRAFSRQGSPSPAWAAFALAGTVGLLDEIWQGALPDRFFFWGDVALDGIAGALALGMVTLAGAPSPSRRRPPAWFWVAATGLAASTAVIDLDGLAPASIVGGWVRGRGEGAERLSLSTAGWIGWRGAAADRPGWVTSTYYLQGNALDGTYLYIQAPKNAPDPPPAWTERFKGLRRIELSPTFLLLGDSRTRWQRSVAAPHPGMRPGAANPPPAAEHLAITWLGQSSFLVEMGSRVILFDPHWGKTAGPFVRRARPPPAPIEDLPPLDLVLVSHFHTDHFDPDAVRQIAARSAGGGPSLVVPEGSRECARRGGLADLVELAWGDAVSRADLVVEAHEAGHVGGRGQLDWLLAPGCEKAGFASYTVEGGGREIFFAGDTGYVEGLFRSIGEGRRIDVAFVPIGPIEPRERMAPHHTDPAEALRVLDDVRARWLVPMHYGTFELPSEPLDRAEGELRRLVAEGDLESRVRILSPGERWVVPPPDR